MANRRAPTAPTAGQPPRLCAAIRVVQVTPLALGGETAAARGEKKKTKTKKKKKKKARAGGGKASAAAP